MRLPYKRDSTLSNFSISHMTCKAQAEFSSHHRLPAASLHRILHLPYEPADELCLQQLQLNPQALAEPVKEAHANHVGQLLTVSPVILQCSH